MKKTYLFFLSFLIFSLCSNTTFAVIDDVTISPSAPTILDLIDIDVDGTENSGGVEIILNDFTINNTQLTLDLDVRMGNLTVMTPWSYTYEDVGPLGVGDYDLDVIANFYVFDMTGGGFIYLGIQTDYSSFEVTVPEPATICLLGIGALALRRKHRI